jgi:hypothetical protein
VVSIRGAMTSEGAGISFFRKHDSDIKTITMKIDIRIEVFMPDTNFLICANIGSDIE